MNTYRISINNKGAFRISQTYKSILLLQKAEEQAQSNTDNSTYHSYIIELKMLPAKDFEAKAEAQWQEAVEQINRYAAAPRIEVLRQGTTLHKIIIQFAGWEMKRMEDV